jgi:hypothetical protein
MSDRTQDNLGPAELAEVYLRQWAHRRDEDWWAFGTVCDLVRSDPEKAWELTRILVQKAESNAALAYVAAGPLEDLLEIHGPAVIDRVEDESRKHASVRLPLSGVWLSRGCPVYPRWLELMRRYGFADGSRPRL